MQNDLWNIRKICIDIIYTLTILMPTNIGPYVCKSIDLLMNCKFDKVKNVRESAQIALNALREIDKNCPNHNNNNNIVPSNQEQQQIPDLKQQKFIEEQ